LARESVPDGTPQKATLVPSPTHLSAAALARRHGIPTTTLYRWFAQYPGLGIKVAGRWRVDPDALNRLLAGEWLPRRKPS
jgi:hypothetical protein